MVSSTASHSGSLRTSVKCIPDSLEDLPKLPDAITTKGHSSLKRDCRHRAPRTAKGCASRYLQAFGESSDDGGHVK
jgi:hypothetical protein